MSDVRVTWHEDKVVGQLLDVAADGLGASAEDMKQLAQDRCPVLTGFLRSNIEAEEIERDDEQVTVAIGVNDVVEYAEIQEERHHFIESSVRDLASLVPESIIRAAEKKQGI